MPVEGYEPRRIEVRFRRTTSQPETPTIYADGPDDSPHRFAPARKDPRSSLCIWHPDDSPERRWVPRDISLEEAMIGRDPSDDVASVYRELVRKTREVAGGIIKRSWDEPPISADSEMHAPEIATELQALRPHEDAYLDKVATAMKGLAAKNPAVRWLVADPPAGWALVPRLITPSPQLAAWGPKPAVLLLMTVICWVPSRRPIQFEPPSFISGTSRQKCLTPRRSPLIPRIRVSGGRNGRGKHAGNRQLFTPPAIAAGADRTQEVSSWR